MKIERYGVPEAKLLAGKHTELLLDIGSTLLASGAHSERINRNVKRIAEHWNYDVDIFFSFTGLIVTLQRKDDPYVYATRHKRVAHHGVNFSILNEISLLSWRVKEENLEPDEVEQDFTEIKKTPHYPRWAVLLFVGLACAALCLVSKGDWKDASITFFASVAGLLVRQELTRLRFNPMIGILMAAFVTTLLAGADVLFRIGASPEKALATSVLYLVPGVPLINSVIDLIEGYVPTAIARGLFGGFILLCIALGMSLSILLIGIRNF